MRFEKEKQEIAEKFRKLLLGKMVQSVSDVMYESKDGVEYVSYTITFEDDEVHQVHSALAEQTDIKEIRDGAMVCDVDVGKARNNPLRFLEQVYVIVQITTKKRDFVLYLPTGFEINKNRWLRVH